MNMVNIFHFKSVDNREGNRIHFFACKDIENNTNLIQFTCEINNEGMGNLN